MKTIKKITENISFSLFNNYETIRKLKNKINEVIDAVNSIPAPISPEKELPDVSTSDNGDILAVVSGEWAKSTPQKELPDVSASDNGDVLIVANGAWTKGTTQHNYSTTEKIIGTWIDGSALYELSGLFDAGSTDVQLDFSIDTLIDLKVGMIDNDYKQTIATCSGTSSRFANISNSNLLHVNNYGATCLFYIIQYTKSVPVES